MSTIELSLLAIFGLAWGSFSNNLANYFIRGEFDWGRSTCLCGDKNLSLAELIPVFSFLRQKGNCNTCSFKIPKRYLFVEVFTVIITLLVFYFRNEFGAAGVLQFSTVWLLLMIAVIDLEIFIIPDVVLGLVLVIEVINRIMSETGIVDRLPDAIGAGLFFVFLKYGFKKIRGKDPLGWGDIKLIGLLGFIVGIYDLVVGIWLAAVLGIILGKFVKREGLIPFGFFLGLVFLVLLIFKPDFEYYFVKWMINT